MNKTTYQLNSLKFSLADSFPSKLAPYYYKLINDLFISKERKQVVYLDKNTYTSSLIIFLLSRHILRSKFSEYITNFANKEWSIGDKVVVKPSKFVFTYGGQMPENNNFFWLSLLNKPDSKRTFPIMEMARLEKTEKVRPKGGFGSPLDNAHRAAIDKYLGDDIATYGNMDIFPNICFVLGKTNSLKRIFDSLRVQINKNEIFSFSDIFPFGSISSNGEIFSSDLYQTEQSPVLALTSSLENCFIAAHNHADSEKLILIDGIEKFDIHQKKLNFPESSKLIILADRKDISHANILADQGFRINYLSDDEILNGIEFESNSKNVLFGDTLSKAKNRKSLKLNFYETNSNQISSLYSKLETIAQHLDESFLEDELLDKIFLKFLGLFYDCCEICQKVPESIFDNLEILKKQINSLSHNLRLRDSFLDLIYTFEVLTEEFSSNPSPKYKKLKDLEQNLNYEEKDSWLVLGRQKNLEGFPYQQISSFCIERSEKEDPGKVAFIGWPNKIRFQKFWNLHRCDDLTFICYPEEKYLYLNFINYEKKLLDQFSKKNNLENFSNYLDSLVPRSKFSINLFSKDTKDQFSKGLIEKIENKIKEKSFKVDISEDNLLLIKPVNSRLAFFGNNEARAWISEGHKFYVLDDIYNNKKNDQIKLTTIDDLEQGNFVLFRDKGDRELISMIAEEIIGKDEYESKKALSSLWREALLSISDSPSKCHEILSRMGSTKSVQTIGLWLRDDNLIGPQDLSDIELINSIVDLNYKFDEIKTYEAIEFLRSLHLRAGNKLTEMLIEELKDKSLNFESGITLEKLSFGNVWVAEFDGCTKDKTIKPYSDCNHLIFDEF